MRRTMIGVTGFLAVLVLIGCRRGPVEDAMTDQASTTGPGGPACDPGNAGLTLPAGYCATLFASVRGVREVGVAPNGDVFAVGRGEGITALRDRDGDGHADTAVTFGAGSGTGIVLGRDAIFFAPNDRVIRFNWTPGSLTPNGDGIVIVQSLPAGHGHVAKTLALTPDGKSIFVDHGSASNSCQVVDRSPQSPGKNPCPELATRAGTWRYDTHTPGQTPASGVHWTTGVRNGMALAVDPATGELWGATHGRDDLRGTLGVSDRENAEKPAEEFGLFAKGADYGWPYCYYDPMQKRKVKAPEYGGDGTAQGDCASKTQPVIAFPAHWAPMSLVFVPKGDFGAAYQGGAFIAFHGSWNRAPLPQAGFRVVFIPFANGKPTGAYHDFAQGTDEQLRISGVAMPPDGSALFIASDGSGKIWRVIPTNPRS